MFFLKYHILAMLFVLIHFQMKIKQLQSKIMLLNIVTKSMKGPVNFFLINQKFK